MGSVDTSSKANLELQLYHIFLTQLFSLKELQILQQTESQRSWCKLVDFFQMVISRHSSSKANLDKYINAPNSITNKELVRPEGFL
jgi:hypothetical protein